MGAPILPGQRRRDCPYSVSTSPESRKGQQVLELKLEWEKVSLEEGPEEAEKRKAEGAQPASLGRDLRATPQGTVDKGFLLLS